jgi:hypothetical protein
MKLVERTKLVGGVALGFVDRSKVDPREAWLLENKSALQSLLRGIEQAERGEVYDLGSFADFADDEIE